jgi:hypothetical protein
MYRSRGILAAHYPPANIYDQVRECPSCGIKVTTEASIYPNVLSLNPSGFVEYVVCARIPGSRLRVLSIEFNHRLNLAMVSARYRSAGTMLASGLVLSDITTKDKLA